MIINKPFIHTIETLTINDFFKQKAHVHSTYSRPHVITMYMYTYNINREDTKFQSHVPYSAKFPKTVTFTISYPNTFFFFTKQHITMKKSQQ